MGRPVILLVLLICMSTKMTAQLKKADSPSNSTIGFKKQSNSTSGKKKATVKNSASVPTEPLKLATPQSKVSQAEKENQAKALEIIRVDYNAMPAEVKQKISNNKTQGKYLLDGIAKAFLVEIKTCMTEADQIKTLSFLKSKKGFIQSQLASPGVVKLIVDPSFDSPDLKELMANGGVQFNFLNRSYLLKTNQLKN